VEHNENGQTQETQQKRGKSARIPVPKPKDVFRDLGKVAKPRHKPAESPAGDVPRRLYRHAYSFRYPWSHLAETWK
jgi:hypothetical protein